MDNQIQVAAIRQQPAEEMQKINAAKLEAMLFTDAYTIPAGCTNCKTTCRIPAVLPEFQKTYEKVGNRIFTLLQMIDSYNVICNQNALRKALIANCQQANQQCQAFGQPLKYDESEIKRYESEVINTKSGKHFCCRAIRHTAQLILRWYKPIGRLVASS